MFKKMGISLLLGVVMFVSIVHVGLVTTVYANPTCRTVAECRDLQRTARDNIAEIMEQEEELRRDIVEVQDEISRLRSEITTLENTIRTLAAEIEALEADIADLVIETAINLEILDETADQIDDLIDQIAGRMRLAQRANNRNSLLVMLSEAEDLTTFLRITRRFSSIATDDAAFMDELTELVEFQENLLVELAEQQEELEARRVLRQLRVEEVAQQQANLEATQYTLIAREVEMQDILYLLYEDRLSEEEVLAMAAQIQEVLERTPPPVAPASSPASSNSAPSQTGSGSSSGAGSPSGTQVANTGGLAHPMPGGRMISAYGWRNGRPHHGVDIVVNGNTRANILAAAAGTVTLSGWHNSMGNWVIISHNLDGQRVDTVYAHLRYSPPVSVGQVVAQGEVIGVKGSTGHSSGPHLHFEVHPGGFSWSSNSMTTFRGTNPCNWISC